MQVTLLRSFHVSRLSTIAVRAMVAMVAVLALLGTASVFVMTLGTDEAWVLNGIRSTLQPHVPYLSTELITTSGGLFALANLAVESVASGQLWLHRSISLLCLVLTLLLVLKAGASKSAPASAKWLMVAPLLAVPGLFEIGTAALGTSTGLLLLVAAMVLWSSLRASLAVRAVLGGLLYGLAAAARFDLVLFGPALLLVSCLRMHSGSLEFRLNLPAWAFVIIGAAVFLLNQWIMSLPANAASVETITVSAGLQGWTFNYTKLLNHWVTLAAFAPLALLALTAASAFWYVGADAKTATAASDDRPSFEALLAAAGVVLLVGWLARAPIPHLRYALPSLFCFAVLGAIGLQRVAAHALANGRATRFFLCQLIALACLLGAIGNLTRSLVMSDSDYASWEWTREMPHDYYRRFEARLHQQEIAKYLRTGLEADAMLYSYVPYALRYLTRRPVIAVDAPPRPSTATRANRYLVLTPMIGMFLYMNPETAAWLKANAPLVKQIGRYSVYRLPAGGDQDLDQLKLRRLVYDHHPLSAPWFGR